VAIVARRYIMAAVPAAVSAFFMVWEAYQVQQPFTSMACSSCATILQQLHYSSVRWAQQRCVARALEKKEDFG